MTEERVIYAWVLDGISTVYVSDEALDDVWAVTQGFVDAYPGLVLPRSLPVRSNLRKLSPEQANATISVRDIDSTLAGVFGLDPSTADDLVTTLEVAPLAGASLFSKHVGTERMGPAGERHRYPFVPGYTVGQRHLGTNEAFGIDGAPAPVSDVPVLWQGRRCAVYRVRLVAGVWETLADADLLWYGTMRGQGKLDKHVWSFSCHGPESLMGALVGTGNFQDSRRVIPLTTLISDGQAGQTLQRARLDVISLSNQLDVAHSYVFPTDALADDDSYLAGATTYEDIVAGVELFLDDLVGSVVNGFAFDRNGNDIRFSTAPGFDGITVTWYRGDTAPDAGDPYITAASNLRYTARLLLTLHERVWRALGYDVRAQTGELDPVDDELQYGLFSSTQDNSGYWQGEFYAANPTAMAALANNDFDGEVVPDDYSSGGSSRVWPPLYRGGAVAFDGTPGQEFQVFDLDELRLEGSRSRPLMGDPDDETQPRTISGGVGEVTDQGLVVFEGPYRRESDDDKADPVAGFAFELSRERREGKTIQVVRAGWRRSGGIVVADSDGLPRLVIYEWLDPRLFGFDYPPLAGGTWASFRDPPPGPDPISMRALVALEYSSEGDKSAQVLRRLLLSTGDAGGWFADAGLTTPLYGLGGQAAFLDVGANDDGADLAGDAEVSTLGLAVPAQLVASESAFEFAFAPAENLARCKVAATTGTSSAALVSALLEPAGVAIGFSSGKITPFDAWALPTPDEAVAFLTPEGYGVKPNGDPLKAIPKQGLRKYAPIDVLELDARVQPVTGEYFRKIKRSTSDLGATYRAASSVVQRVRGDYLISPALPVLGNDWPASVALRWRDGFAFWAARHTTATLTLKMSVGKDIWPGDGVLVSDPWLLDTLGLYGLTAAAARVLTRDVSPELETVKLEVLIGAETDYRLYAPSARVYRYDEQDLGPDFRLLCDDDALADRGGLSFDVDGFAEPSWSSSGGQADVELFQFDSETWTRGIFGTVASVAGLVGASTITLTGALTGATFLPDRHTIVVMREFASQSAQWVLDVYAPICDEDGEHSGGQTGVKWRGL